MTDQRLQPFGDPCVFLVVLLIQIELLTFDRIETSAAELRIHIAAELMFDRGDSQLEVGIVAPFPGQPVGRPPRVRPLNRICTEWECGSEGAIELGKLSGIKGACSRRKGLPPQHRTRISGRGNDGWRENRQQCRRLAIV